MQKLLDDATLRRHRWRNGLLTAAILLAMAALLGGIGWSLAGFPGLVLVAVIGLGYLLWTPSMDPASYLLRSGAREVSWRHELKLIVAELAKRAELDRVPRVFYLRTRGLNAFAMGSKSDATITVTSGLLETLDRREVVGVLAHEISHILNSDLRIMGIANSVSRLTVTMSRIGLALLLFNLPMWLLQGSGVPLLAVLLMILAPTLADLMQLALSRAREYDADATAIKLTQDPAGLASALDKLDRIYQRLRAWIRFFAPRAALESQPPEILSSHPETRNRIDRLRELGQRAA